MTATYADFEYHVLDDGHHFFVGQPPDLLRLDVAGFEALWSIHPDNYQVIQVHGRPADTPRWQQAYGVDYHYTGRTNSTLPVPSSLVLFRDWARHSIDDRLNRLLLNWYDGTLGHYIGPHRDSIKGMVVGGPIVTISFGENRVFRLTHPERKLTRDFQADSGAIFAMSYDTNPVWNHPVPKFTRHQGPRISLTLRAFVESARSTT